MFTTLNDLGRDKSISEAPVNDDDLGSLLNGKLYIGVEESRRIQSTTVS